MLNGFLAGWRGWYGMTSEPSANEVDHRADPRAPVRGIGFLFQTVGLILLLGGCLIGGFSGLIQGEQDYLPLTAGEWFRQSPPGQLLAAINIVVTGVAGLALLVFGLGLHQERRTSGIGAVITTAILALTWWATTVAAILLAPSAPRIVLYVLFAGAATILLLLAIRAARLLRRYPPPPDPEVTREFLDQFSRRREPAEEDDFR
jgi:lysylphosphatidylglycerol synthetase-like protein (DUF2156 family)